MWNERVGAMRVVRGPKIWYIQTYKLFFDASEYFVLVTHHAFT